MHQDRNNGKWPELKAKRRHNSNDEPLDSIDVDHSFLDGETRDSLNAKKALSEKHLSNVKNMFKDMADYRKQKNDA